MSGKRNIDGRTYVQVAWKSSKKQATETANILRKDIRRLVRIIPVIDYSYDGGKMRGYGIFEAHK